MTSAEISQLRRERICALQRAARRHRGYDRKLRRRARRRGGRRALPA